MREFGWGDRRERNRARLEYFAGSHISTYIPPLKSHLKNLGSYAPTAFAAPAAAPAAGVLICAGLLSCRHSTHMKTNCTI